MSEDDSISRRDFLKLIGLGTLTLSALGIENSLLFKLLYEKQEASNIEPDRENYPFGEFVDPGYPTIAWTRANLAVAVSLLDGKIIQPKQNFSLLNCLLPDPNNIDYNNTDASKGFVYGRETKSPFSHTPASGICKSATDLFRCALSGPIVIVESHSHHNIYPKHPYFVNYPYGTDAAIYIDPQKNIKYDLIINNPWDFPVRLNYRLFDKNGERITPRDLFDKIDPQDYFLGLWVKYIEGMQQVGIPVQEGIIPNAIEVLKITPQLFFEPAGTLNGRNIPKWKVELEGPTKLADGQYELRRSLYIDGKIVDRYTRITNY